MSTKFLDVSPEMVSLSRLARLLDAPEYRVRDKVRSGAVRPDAVAGRTQLFRRDRVESIRQTINAEVTR